MKDTLVLEILEDGVISVTSDKVSTTNHVSADNLLDLIEELAGGERTTTKREVENKHRHVHRHAKVKA